MVCPRDGHELQELTEDPLLQTVLDERYRITRLIGEGAMGRVYLAEHLRIGKRFAIKTLYGDLSVKKGMRARFQREAEAASRLEHPNLVSIIDFGTTEMGLMYLVMEYIEGRSLEEVIQEEGPLPEPRVIRLASDMARGLAHAHARSLVHRDLKTENVLVMRDAHGEHPKIVDFGVALIEGPEVMRVTSAGAVIGTPAFMSPEQARGIPVDARSDLYSLGVLMYHMVAGRGPFWGSPVEVMKQLISAPVPPVYHVCKKPTAGPALEAVIMRLLEKNPADRFPDADALLQTLEELLVDLGPTRRLHLAAPEEPTEVKEVSVSATPTDVIEPTARISQYSNVTDPADDPKVWASDVDETAAADANEPVADADETVAADSNGTPSPSISSPDVERTRRWAFALLGLVFIAMGLLIVLLWRQSSVQVIASNPSPDPVAKTIEPLVITEPPPEAPAKSATVAVARSAVVDAGTPDAGEPAETAQASADDPPEVATPVPKKRRAPRRPRSLSLDVRLERLGQSIERLADQRGASYAAPFEKRMFSLPPISSVLKDPNSPLGRQYVQQLTQLERDVRKARRR